jgi:hypothetical protein
MAIGERLIPGRKLRLVLVRSEGIHQPNLIPEHNCGAFDVAICVYRGVSVFTDGIRK